MGQPVIVVNTDENPTPVSPPSPDDTPAEIVTALHDDALEMGRLIERVNTLEMRVIEVENSVGVLAGNQAAAVAAIDATVSAVEGVRDAVEEIAEETDATPDPAPVVEEQPEDSTPGKSHWLYRSGEEWRGRE